MKFITLYISCFLYSILCTLSMADVVSRLYTVDASLDNKVLTNGLMTKHNLESLTECSAKCGELCTCFGFNLQLKKCHIHQSCDSSELTTNEAGWRYYKPDGLTADLDENCWGLHQKGIPLSADLGVDCLELHEKGHVQSGVYQINPTGEPCHKIRVYCDMETSGGGWTVIQKRVDGSTYFYRNWTHYKRGFGEPSQNYWIGNDAIHALTNGTQELRVDVEEFNNQTAYALYSNFKIENENNKYRLSVSGYTGTAGHCMEGNDGHMFSTWDQDNDSYNDQCAVEMSGGWWYWGCGYSNLNGPYVGYALYGSKTMFWFRLRNVQIALKSCQMMIRHKS